MLACQYAGFYHARMKCDLCDQPAVVHEVVVRHGEKKEIHLCEHHAQEHGYTVAGQPSLDQMLTKFVVSEGQTKQSRVSQKKCSTCGLSFARFRQHGLLGCPDCYDAFEKNLSALIERTHAGATHHVGKTPNRADESLERQRLIQRLVNELDEAVCAEQYERAAELRDRLRNLEESGATVDGDGASHASQHPDGTPAEPRTSRRQIEESE